MPFINSFTDKFAICLLAFGLSFSNQATTIGDDTITFESLPLSGGGFYNGDINAPGGVRDNYSIVGSTPRFGVTEYHQLWTDGSAAFENNFLDDPVFPSWQGWVWSNVEDATSPGFTNQYASATGGGSNGLGGVDAGGNYAVAFLGSEVEANGTPLRGSTFTLNEASHIDSLDLSNTTYAARFIQDGLDGFGTTDFNANHQFGAGDFYRLFITGFDDVNGTGNETGSVTVELASGDDSFLTGWNTIDLAALGQIRSVTLSATSSQISTFFGDSFLDTPSYVAVDNIRISAPEPSGLVALAVLTVFGLGRRRSIAMQRS